MGFYRPAGIGGPWRKTMEDRQGPTLKGDFERLLALEFRHALSGHGPPLRETAKEDLRATVQKVWG